MFVETIQISGFTALVVSFAILILVPATLMAMSRLPMEALASSTDTPDGASCDLPPLLEIDGRTGEALVKDVPPLDMRTTKNQKTATFAMG